MSNPYAQRIRNLIRRGNPERAMLQKWALIRLLDNQPEAVAIRFEGRCDACKRKKVLLSYQLPQYSATEQRPDLARRGREFCGYYCPSCGWGNAGSRKEKTK